MARLTFALIAIFLSAFVLRAQTADYGYDADLFTEGSVLPLDTIVIQVSEDDRIGFLKPALIVSENDRGTYKLRDVLSGETVAEFPVAFGQQGIIEIDPEAAAGMSDELAAVVVKAGCGRWWKGRNNYWQICGGRESCGGDGSQDSGRRWCTRLVSRDRCESQSNCPTNNSEATSVLFRTDLPIGILPPVDELRYCCKLKCTSIHPSSCTTSCQEVPVGPCETFTVNCPGALGEGGCKWD